MHVFLKCQVGTKTIVISEEVLEFVQNKWLVPRELSNPSIFTHKLTALVPLIFVPQLCLTAQGRQRCLSCAVQKHFLFGALHLRRVSAPPSPFSSVYPHVLAL